MRLQTGNFICLLAYIATHILIAESGWILYKDPRLKISCYGSGIRRFIKPPSIQKCLSFCDKYKMKFCEYDMKKQDGFCYAKEACSKIVRAPTNRAFAVYIKTKGNKKYPQNPRPDNRKSRPKPKKNASKGKPKRTRDPSRPLTVKMGIVVANDLAKDFYKLYGISKESSKEDILKTQVLTNYMDGLNKEYADKSIGKLNIKIVFTHFSVVKKSTWRKWRNVYDFCKSPTQTALEGVDVVMYLVRSGGKSSKGVKLTSAGRSITSGICKKESRCGMVNEVPSVDTAYRKLTAHELAHIIGLIDDGPGLKSKLRRSRKARKMANKKQYPYDDLRCVGRNVKSVMSGRADTWSKCSRDKFKVILGSDLSACFDTPAKSPMLPDPSDFLGKYKSYTREELCQQLRVQDPNTASWKIHYRKPATESECKFAKGECYQQAPSVGGRFAPMKTYDDVPFMQGAKCSNGFCYFGECKSPDKIVGNLKKYLR